jgi:hypothetical protein
MATIRRGLWMISLLAAFGPQTAEAMPEPAEAAVEASPAATDAAAAEAPPQDAAVAEAPTEDAPDDAAAWGADFGDDATAADDDAADADDTDDAEPADLDWGMPGAKLVTVPGGPRYRMPPVKVGQSGRPRHSWVYKNLTALRYNPLGLVNEHTTGYRLQLFDKDSAIFSDSYLGVKLHTWVTPAYARLGPRIELQPFALLNLAASYEFVGYFETFGLMQSFPSPTSDYSDTRIDELQDEGTNYNTTGGFVTLSALLQAKVGPIAARNNVQFFWADYKLRDGDRVFYSQMLDILQANRGWAVSNDTDLLWLVNDNLKIAGRYSVTHAFYDEGDFLPVEPVSRPNGPTHRVGPGVLYTFFDRPTQRFNKPTLILLAQWWLQHRYRTGQDVTQGLPQIVLGFVFEGDLLPHPQRRKDKPPRGPAKSKKDRKAKEKRR